MFLIFVGIAAVFWYVLALNDETQSSYDLTLDITDVPDSVTFISTPPARVHVTVRDRGLNLMRYQLSGLPHLAINFREYAEEGRFRVTHSSLLSSLRRVFGSNATISSVTPDSLNVVYTTYPGKLVPIVLDYDVSAVSGMVMGAPQIDVKEVEVFGTSKMDTVKRVYTEKVVLGSLDKTTTVEVPLRQPAGTRVIPSSVNVTFVVQQLVKKESEVLVEPDNIPLGHDILFFPSRVRVSYYVPMNRYGETAVPVKVEASFNEAFNATTDKVAIRVVSQAPYVSNVELLQDSVEYTVVKGN